MWLHKSSFFLLSWHCVLCKLTYLFQFSTSSSHICFCASAINRWGGVIMFPCCLSLCACVHPSGHVSCYHNNSRTSWKILTNQILYRYSLPRSGKLIRFRRLWSLQGQIFEWVIAAGGGIHINALASKYHLVYTRIESKGFLLILHSELWLWRWLYFTTSLQCRVPHVSQYLVE